MSLLTSLSGLENIEYIYFILINNVPNLTDISSLYDVDSISYFGIYNTGVNEISGFNKIETLQSLNIGYNDSLSSITGFSNLNTVEHLNLTQNDSLSNLSGLSNLEMVTYLNFASINLITDLLAFSSLEEVQSISLYDLDWSTIELNPLTNFNQISISSLPNLNDLDFLSSTDSLDGLYLYNLNIDDINELSNLVYCKSLNLESLPRIKDVDPLSKCTEIEEITFFSLDSLTDISGLYNVDANSLQDLILDNLPLLTDCSIKSFCDYFSGPGASHGLGNNGNGCNSINEILNNCCKDTLIIDWPYVVGGVYEANESIILKSNLPANTTITLSHGISGKAMISDSVIIDLSSSINVIEDGCND